MRSTAEGSAPPVELADPRRADVPRPLIGLLLAFAIFIAWYVGFRLPNAWSATLQAVSVTDGFHRRFVVGTLLRPVALATDYSYWTFAAFSFLVLAGLLAILVVVALREQHLSRKLLVIAFLLLPTGPFLFHEAGYLEQVLYLLLFLGLVLLQRGRWIAALLVMSVAPFVHEIAIATVIPVFGLAALRTLPFRRALLVTLVPAMLDLVVLASPTASSTAIQAFTSELASANFPVRHDALALFARSQAESWQLYEIHEEVVKVKPVAMFLLASFAVIWWTQRDFWRTGESHRVPPIAMFAASAAAIALPGLLVYAGWDHNRWTFLMLANFFIVLWLTIGRRPPRLKPGTAVVMFTAILALSHVSLPYFPTDEPRKLGYREVRDFIGAVADGSFFEIPAF